MEIHLTMVCVILLKKITLYYFLGKSGLFAAILINLLDYCGCGGPLTQHVERLLF